MSKFSIITSNFQKGQKMEKDQNVSLVQSHVVIFPLPVQGHINSMLKLAEILSLSSLKVTFITTLHNYDRLTRFTDFRTHFNKYPDFPLKTVPEFLPEGHSLGARMVDIMESMDSVIKPVFRTIIVESSRPVNCVIMDGMLTFVSEIANEFRIPFIHFRTTSASSFWTYFSIHDLVQASQLPIKGEKDMDRIITKVPGMETFLRCRDLPSFCRVSDSQVDSNLQIITKVARNASQAQALILNTFEDLEGPILSQIRKQCPKIYAIGPLHDLLKAQTQESYQSSNSLLEVDTSCVIWLNTQPSQSVIYVSFGSITMITKDQLLEFWQGIVSSKNRFLWVIRPESVTNSEGELEEIPEQFKEGPKENGYVVKWAPQEEVLAHKAIGGFFTHSGWNSTLESIVAGVPMICWPFFADQQVNSRFVSEVWKLGLDMKDVCDRRIVEKMVNDLMVDRREEFVESAARMAELARKSVGEGGSSSSNLNRLIEDIRLMCMQNITE